MDRDKDLPEAPNLTKEITIKNYAPVFVGAYSHIFKGFYRGEPVSCDLFPADRLRICQVAIKVLRYNGVSLRAMIRVGDSINHYFCLRKNLESDSRAGGLGADEACKCHPLVRIHRRERAVWTIWSSHFSGETNNSGIFLLADISVVAWIR